MRRGLLRRIVALSRMSENDRVHVPPRHAMTRLAESFALAALKKKIDDSFRDVCAIETYSSRMCERGTAGCVTQHVE